jgi:transposase
MDPALTLTGRQAKAIKGMRWKAKKSGNTRLLLRCHAVLMLDHGLIPDAVASILGVHLNSIRGWIRRVKQHGVGGLEDKEYPGAKPKLDPEQQAALVAIIREPPEKAGLDTGVWTGPLVREIILKRFGVTYDVSQVRRILNRLGFSVQYPRVRLSKGDAEKQKEWLAEKLPAIKKSLRGQRRSDVRGRGHLPGFGEHHEVMGAKGNRSDSE